MKKRLAIQISIPEPCTQAWDEMQPVPGGRHCAHCQKAVVDFTRMTDAQLLAYFQKNGGAACGRFTDLQLDRVIKAVEVPRSTWWARLAAGLILSLGLSKEANGQDKRLKNLQDDHHSKTSVSLQPPLEHEYNPKGSEIYGTLKDERGDPIVNAYVEVSKGDIVKGSAMTDFDGNYSIKSLDSSQYNVRFRVVPESCWLSCSGVE